MSKQVLQGACSLNLWQSQINANFTEVYNLRPINVLGPPGGLPAVADGSYSDASGTDNAARLQAMIDASLASGWVPQLQFPTGSDKGSYVVRSSLTLGTGSNVGGTLFEGYGGGFVSGGVRMPAPIIWGGSAGQPIIDIATSSQNIPMTAFRNIMIAGRSDGASQPSNCIRFRGTGGVNTGIVDSGSMFDDVWLMRCSGDALRMEQGATNVYWRNGRIETWGDYAIYMAGGSLTIDGNATFTNQLTCKGMIDLDGETNSKRCVLKMIGVKLEHEILSQTWDGTGGTGFTAFPFDKRGLIRCRVDRAYSGQQHKLYIAGLEVYTIFSIPSYSIVQATSTTTDDANMDITRRVSINGDELMGIWRGATDTDVNDITRMYGGRVHVNHRPTQDAGYSNNCSQFIHNWGPNTSGDAGWSYHHTQDTMISLMRPRAYDFADLPTDWPKDDMIAVVRNYSHNTRGTAADGSGSTRVFVRRLGSSWLVM
jgi:hypothetical protein